MVPLTKSLATVLLVLATCGCGSSEETTVRNTPRDAGHVDALEGGTIVKEGGAGPEATPDQFLTLDSGQPDCTPVSTTESECDGLDDDCNGRIDDVDKQKDGICDCLSIGLLGQSGPNPSSNFEQWLQQKGTSVKRFQTGATDTLTSAELAAYDVVILDKLLHDYQASEAAALQSWLEAGGGIVSMTGHTGNASVDFRHNVLLAPLGVAYGGSLFNGPVTSFQPHSTTTGLTSVTFLGGYVVGEVTAPNVKRTSVASLSSGTVGYALELAKGKAFVWGDEWIEYDSEWTTLPEIKQLWVNVLQWVGPQEKCVLGEIPK